MFVLEATQETQGRCDDDYAWAVDGELVFVPLLDCRDEACGCARGFAGMTSRRATTTARIVDRVDLDEEVYRDLLIEGMTSQGYDLCGQEHLEDAVDEMISATQMLGRSMGPGTVLGRFGAALLVRAPGNARGWR